MAANPTRFDAADRPAAAATIGGLARSARYLALVLAVVLTAGALGQFFLAGLNVFDAPRSWSGHIALGSSLGLVAYVVWIPVVVGRLGRRMLLGATLLPVLFTLQHVFPAMDQAAVRALHPVNGALILVVSLWLALRTGERLRRPPPSTPA